MLKAVSLGPLQGYGVLQRIVQISGNQPDRPTGFAYPALYRLEASGALATEWSTSDNNRRAKSHCLTGVGRLQLTNEIERWRE